MKEVFYTVRFHPELDKQVQSFDLTLFPMGTGIMQGVKLTFFPSSHLAAKW